MWLSDQTRGSAKGSKLTAHDRETYAHTHTQGECLANTDVEMLHQNGPNRVGPTTTTPVRQSVRPSRMSGKQKVSSVSFSFSAPFLQFGRSRSSVYVIMILVILFSSTKHSASLGGPGVPFQRSTVPSRYTSQVTHETQKKTQNVNTEQAARVKVMDPRDLMLLTTAGPHRRRRPPGRPCARAHIHIGSLCCARESGRRAGSVIRCCDVGTASSIGYCFSSLLFCFPATANDTPFSIATHCSAQSERVAPAGCVWNGIDSKQLC